MINLRLFTWTAIVCLVVVLQLLLPSAAQSSTTTSADSSSTSSSGNDTNGQIVITSRIVTTITPSLGASPTPTTLISTLTINQTSSSSSATSTSDANGTTNSNSNSVTFTNGTTIFANGTVSVNATATNLTEAEHEPFNGTQTGLPFNRKIDPGYGVAGAYLMITGGFVGVLGGKHKWSTMAIVSGYSVLLFTLVMILSFGVQPSIQPPSPKDPSTLERGLYTLACIISSFIGAAVGLFVSKYTKFWVCAMGGFAFSWFLLALKTGGLFGSSLVGRWCLVIGCTVLGFIVGLFNTLHSHFLLISTAWIGATAFTLGLDCFTMGGLKEFYVYNLGYASLFPSLNGYPYPITTLMQVELGIMGACFVIGTAIQYKVLGAPYFKARQGQQEERARNKAQEVAESQMHAKKYAKELSEWDQRYGSKAGSSLADRYTDRSQTELGDGDAYSILPRLNEKGMSIPDLNFSEDHHGSSSGKSTVILPKLELGQHLAPLLGVRSSSHNPAEADLGEQENLLDEIRKVKANIEALRNGTSSNLAPLMHGHNASQSRRQSETVSFKSAQSAPLASGMTSPVGSSENAWQRYLDERKIYTPPAGVTPPIPSGQIRTSNGRLSRISPDVLSALKKRERTLSAFELGSMADSGGTSATTDPATRYNSMTSLGSNHMSPRDSYFPPDPSPVSRPAPSTIRRPDSRVIGTPESDKRSPRAENAVSFEELETRHKVKMSKLQRSVTENIEAETRLAETKTIYDKKQELERRSGAARVEGKQRLNTTTRPTTDRTQIGRTMGLSQGFPEGVIEKGAKLRSTTALDTALDPKPKRSSSTIS